MREKSGSVEARPFASKQCLCGSEIPRYSSSLFIGDFSTRRLRHGRMSIFLIHQEKFPKS